MLCCYTQNECLRANEDGLARLDGHERHSGDLWCPPLRSAKKVIGQSARHLLDQREASRRRIVFLKLYSRNIKDVGVFLAE